MDPRLDENEAELGVLVLAVALKMLSDSDGLVQDFVSISPEAGKKRREYKNLLDQHVQVLRDLGSNA